MLRNIRKDRSNFPGGGFLSFHKNTNDLQPQSATVLTQYPGGSFNS